MTENHPKELVTLDDATRIPRIMAVVNPQSGINIRDKLRFWKICSIIGRKNVYASKSYEDLQRIACEIAEAKPDIIAIDGGDGTISTVVEALWRNWPKGQDLPAFALLGGGTFNAMAKYAGIKKGIPYLKKIAKTPVSDLFFQDADLMKISNDSGMVSLGFSFGLGLPVSLLRDFYKKKRLKYIRIFFMAIRLLLSKLFNGKYFRKFNRKYSVYLNQQHGRWLAVMCQSIPSFGAPRCYMFYRSGLTRGKFHLLATDSPLSELGWYITAIYGGKGVPIMRLDQQIEKLQAKSDEEFHYQVNGELEYWGQQCLAKEVFIENGITLKIVRPIP